MKQLADLSLGATPLALLFRDEESLIISTARNENPQPPIGIWTGEPIVYRNGGANTVSGATKSQLETRVKSEQPTNRPDFVSQTLSARSTVSIWDRDLRAELGRLPPGDYYAPRVQSLMVVA